MSDYCWLGMFVLVALVLMFGFDVKVKIKIDSEPYEAKESMSDD